MSMQRNNNKKGITFAELMISLVVISVIAAVLYPTIAQFTPNSNKPLFKSAYSTLSSVLFEITNSYPSGRLPTVYPIIYKNDKGTDVNVTYPLCVEFCEVANVLPEDESYDCTVLCADGIITTTNGMRWRIGLFDTYPSPNYDLMAGGVTNVSNVFRIFVDVNAANNDLSPTTTIADINLSTTATDYKGVFYFEPNKDATKGVYTSLPTAGAPHGVFNTSRIKMQDTFIFLVDDEGKIVAMSPAGSAHLEDSLQSPD